MSGMSKCKKCDAWMRWVVMEKSGKNNPLDPDPVADGNIVVLPDGDTARYVTDEDRRLHRPLYKSHFVTCPFAKDFRKGQAGKTDTGEVVLVMLVTLMFLGLWNPCDGEQTIDVDQLVADHQRLAERARIDFEFVRVDAELRACRMRTDHLRATDVYIVRQPPNVNRLPMMFMDGWSPWPAPVGFEWDPHGEKAAIVDAAEASWSIEVPRRARATREAMKLGGGR